MQFSPLIILLNIISAECGRWTMPKWGKGRSVGPKQPIMTPALRDLAEAPSGSKWAKAGEVITVAGKGGMAFAGAGTLFHGIGVLIGSFRGETTTTEEYYSQTQVRNFL